MVRKFKIAMSVVWSLLLNAPSKARYRRKLSKLIRVNTKFGSSFAISFHPFPITFAYTLLERSIRIRKITHLFVTKIKYILQKPLQWFCLQFIYWIKTVFRFAIYYVGMHIARKYTYVWNSNSKLIFWSNFSTKKRLSLFA